MPHPFIQNRERIDLKTTQESEAAEKTARREEKVRQKMARQAQKAKQAETKSLKARLIRAEAIQRRVAFLRNQQAVQMAHGDARHSLERKQVGTGCAQESVKCAGTPR